MSSYVECSTYQGAFGSLRGRKDISAAFHVLGRRAAIQVRVLDSKSRTKSEQELLAELKWKNIGVLVFAREFFGSIVYDRPWEIRRSRRKNESRSLS
eukprot:scaffold21_cov136-Skeletonema_marinoi.AAC.7